MNENLELLEYMHENASMGVYTTKQLLKDLKDKDNKIKKVVDNEYKEYQNFVDKIEKIIRNSDSSKKEISMMSKMMSRMGIKKEVDADNSDAAIAHMLTEGITMGVVDMETKINNFKNVVDKKILKLAKDYLKFQQDEIEKLKDFM